MPKISIIIPVYNVESHLKKCIDSILSQTFTDFECILIDDGSTDSCPVICDEYVAKDSRIIVIHQKNAGVSRARNAGLSLAKGEWIGFVDSDDWCDIGMYESLLTNAEKYGADISICGYRIFREGKCKATYPTKTHPMLIMDSNSALKKLCLNKYLSAHSWNKLIRKQLFSCEDEVLRYDEMIQFYEDRLLLFCLFKRATKIVYFPQAYYNYYMHSKSVTTVYQKKGHTKTFMTAFDAYDKMLQIETDKKLRGMILAHEGILAAKSYLRYVNYNGFIYDDICYFYKKIIRSNLHNVLLFGTIEQRIYCFLLAFCPAIIAFAFKFNWIKNILNKN